MKTIWINNKKWLMIQCCVISSQVRLYSTCQMNKANYFLYCDFKNIPTIFKNIRNHFKTLNLVDNQRNCGIKFYCTLLSSLCERDGWVLNMINKINNLKGNRQEPRNRKNQNGYHNRWQKLSRSEVKAKNIKVLKNIFNNFRELFF